MTLLENERKAVRESATLLRHLPLLTDPEHLECFALCVQRNTLDLQLQVDATKLRAMVKVVHSQLPQTSHKHKNILEGEAFRGQ